MTVVTTGTIVALLRRLRLVWWRFVWRERHCAVCCIPLCRVHVYTRQGPLCADCGEATNPSLRFYA